MTYRYLLLSLFLFCASCAQSKNSDQASTADTVAEAEEVIVGKSLQLAIERTEAYLPLLQGKRIGLVVNHTSVFPDSELHLVDFLLKEGIRVQKVFSPEHGFRGTADAGAKVESGTDAATGLPIVSLYGKNKKPFPEQLADVDLLLFDIQDVGARFYTYISTLHYIMEAAAENGKEVVVLDRPNPNGHYIDGPILDPKFKSFVGMHPIPVVHGLTVGELAQMINGEGWLAGQATVKLQVIPMQAYTHATAYTLPIKPSPNLPNMQAIQWYPSLCFFEGTPLSVGRGTAFPFQVVGYPDSTFGSFTFTPEPTPGAQQPKLNGEQCFGIDLRTASPPKQLDLTYLLRYYAAYQEEAPFFIPFFNLLAGTDQLAAQIKAGKTEAEIRESWKDGLAHYRKMRNGYLLYPDGTSN